MSSLSFLNNMPGIDAAIESVENEFLFGPNGLYVPMGIQIDKDTVDAGNTPTTTLRRGLVLGKITSSGQYTHYDADATDGSQVPVGILYQTVNMYDPRTAAVREKSGLMVYTGHVKTGQLYGFDELARVLLGNRFVWDDLRFPSQLWKPVVKTGDYTVLSTDNGSQFETTGAAGAVNFTLPAVAKGYKFRFFNTVNQNMVITAPANTLAGFNDAAATTLTFSTAGEKIGAAAEIVSNEAGDGYLAYLLTNATATYA